MKPEYLIGIIVLVLAGVGLVTLYMSPDTNDASTQALDSYPQPYTEITNPSGFVNTDGITIEELIGKKVILVDFLTYSCINCQRTFPYLNAWYEKYKDQGLEVVGIHTPEFAFEKDIQNVRDAMIRFGINYPIVLDNDYATWRAYKNKYWPRKYLIDIHGNVVYDHIGEGAYEETEMKIRELLQERASVLEETPVETSGDLVSSTVPGESSVAKSPETYFGSKRNEYLANGTPGSAGEQVFVLPSSINKNALYLGGTWNVTPEYVESVSDSEVVYRFDAQAVHIVAESDNSAEIEIFQDEVLQETITINESGLYTLIENDARGEHMITIKVKAGTVKFYAFTFG